MSKSKKIACLATTAVFAAATLAGCGESTSWVVSGNGEELKAGIFLYYQMDGAYEAMELASEDQGDKKLKDVVIDGVSYNDYAQNYALQKTREFYAINQKFEELGLELTDNQVLNADWLSSYYLSSYGDFFTELGIGEESIKEVFYTQQMRSAVFTAYYEVDGIMGTTQDEIDEYFAENYLRFKLINLDLKDADGNLLADADKEAVREDAQEIIDRFNNGENFDNLIEEINGTNDSSSEDASAEDSSTDDSSSEDASAEDSSTDDSSSEDASAEDSSTDDTSSEGASAEDSSTDDTSSEGASAEDSSTDDTSSEDDDSSASDDDSSADDEEEEENPYPNEKVYLNTSTSYSEDFFTALKEAANGSCIMIEEDEVIYVVLKLDITERADYAEDNISSILSGLKSEDFEVLLADWIAQITYETNKKALKRYLPTKMEY